METRPFLVNGEWRTGDDTFDVTSPYDDSVVASIGVPTAADVEEATAVAAETFKESQHLPVHVRSEALDHISKRLSETIPENAELIAREGGKPLKWATVEATRAVSTFRWASETIRAGDDELMRLDTEAALGSRIGLIRRFPIGPVLGITPFNFPLNLVAHKVAPALAVGSPIVVKPASCTPIGVAAAGGVLRRDGPAEGHVPGAARQLEGGRRHGARRPVPEDLVHRVGGDRLVPEGAGSEEARHAGARRQRRRDRALRRGPRSRGARIAFGGYYQAGQSCISVQRVLVASEVYEDFTARLVKQVESLKVGDPMDPTVDVGPVIAKGEVTGSRSGSRRPSRRARRSWWAAPARARSSSRRCSPT